MPWGSLEAKRLGIYDVLLRSCAIEAGFYTRFRSGGAGFLRDLCATNPANTCCMTFPHPAMQEVLLEHARSLRIEVIHGTAVADIKPGNAPTVNIGGDRHGLSALLVVLADGRKSRLRSLLGFDVQRDPEQLITAGIILEGEVDCSEILTGNAPVDASSINLFYDPMGGRMVIAMRIAPKRNRIYLIYHKDVLPRLLSGRHSVDEMIRQLQAAGAPSHWFEQAHQAGPFASFDRSHRWVDGPSAGCGLGRDAAAASDPAWGRGCRELSVTCACCGIVVADV